MTFKPYPAPNGIPQWEWVLKLKLPNGHRVFTNDSGQYALADGSDALPTDILWINRTRPIHIRWQERENHQFVVLPLISGRTGEYLSCSETVEGALAIADLLNMEVYTPLGTFRVIRTGTP